MALKVGDTCYKAWVCEGKIEYDEFVLRTIQARKPNRWCEPISYGYWWQKIPGITWGKLSKKHFDYGWLKNAPVTHRIKCRIKDGRPYAATKAGALKDAIALQRKLIKRYGADYKDIWEDEDEEGVLTYSQELDILLRAQKRLRTQNKKKKAAKRKEASDVDGKV